MLGHLDKTHIGHVAVVRERCRAGGGLHLVAAVKADLRVGVALFQGGNQLGAMQVARCFAGNDEVFHDVRFNVMKS